MGKQRVDIIRRNWDTDFYTDIITGLGFIISDPPEISLDEDKKKSVKSMFGPQSPLYGNIYSDEESAIMRWRCQCGAFVGRQFEGEVCPLCNTKVEAKPTNIKITGWISMGDNKVINPYYYQILQKSIGKAFPDIVSGQYRITTDGKRIKPVYDEADVKITSPFMGIGIDEFYNRYDEILDYFKGVKKAKASTFDRLKNEKKAVFTSHIPVYSTMLRPQSITSDTFYFHSVDKIINTIFTLSENLKNCIDVERDYILLRLQTKLNAYWENTFELINGKDGFIRDQILGGSINYSSRNVICPDPTLRDNEVDVSYNTFIELFKYKIIYYIMRLEDCTLSVAYTRWKQACLKFDESVYNIMTYIVEYDKVKIVINRNPTLNYYSILLMNIRKVVKDHRNFCLYVPLSILSGLNADFDGDILNIIGLMTPELSYTFRKFSPVERMIISRDTGMLNPYFSISKGDMICLYDFCNVPGSENDTPQMYKWSDGRYHIGKEK